MNAIRNTQYAIRKFQVKNSSSGIIFLLFAFCILHSFGCTMISKRDKAGGVPGMLEPQAISKFADIPVPMGFKLLPNESYAFESSGIRVGVLKYQGKADPDRVINFYREQMPMYNWSLLNVIEYGERLMNFDREGETCIIRLLSRGRTLYIVASVGPKPQISKKSTRPVK